MAWKEEDPAYFRPQHRPLKNLSNEELRALFDLRAQKVRDNLDPKGFWENNRIVYWSAMIPLLLSLYEIMVEIQARYPKREIYGSEGREYLNAELLPLLEPQYLALAVKSSKTKLPKSPGDETDTTAVTKLPRGRYADEG